MMRNPVKPLNPRSGLVFSVDGNRYLLPLELVERITPAVRPTPLPKAPDAVLGVISVQGKVIPVFDLRKRFGLAKREIGLSDTLILAHTQLRNVAVLADSVEGVVNFLKEDVVPCRDIVPGMEYIEGIARLGEDLALIQDLGRFLSLDEQEALQEALNSGARA
jgi:purine-binding chemotaxis protein CheW